MRLFIPFYVKHGFKRDRLTIQSILAEMGELGIPHVAENTIYVNWFNRGYHQFLEVYNSIPESERCSITNDDFIISARQTLFENFENLSPGLQTKLLSIIADIELKKYKLAKDYEFNIKKLELESKKVDESSDMQYGGSPFDGMIIVEDDESV